ncbi:hypothetical protein M407DRAFT_216285 [Tulasnella calospora MUT 4182]|uniref:Uncharacterized protein n=1 Tax=Tulasnella calospora MUT 4182 TaxID=1051891 RepID=A0A0C3Q2A9_9AGAM|nr:hypothetical protein M407DRAFT_216285 [Tulasnella calospora MUT 4182]
MPFFLPVRPAFPPTPELSRPALGWAFSAYAEAEREFRKLVGMLVDAFQFGERTRDNQDRKGKQKERATGRELVESYMKLRSLDQERSFLFNIPSRGWTSLLRASTLKDVPSSSSTSVTDIIIRDLADCLSSRRRDEYQQLILDVFDLAASPTAHITISDRQALDLFHALPPGLDPQQYTMTMITRVFDAMLNDSDSQFPIHLPFLATTYQRLISSESAQLAIVQKQSTWILFRFIERLSRLASQSQSPWSKTAQNAEGVVLEVLANVAGAGMIPNIVATTALASAKSALSTSAPTERAETLRVVVLRALVSACFQRQWHAQAMELLSSVVPAARAYNMVQGKHYGRSGHLGKRFVPPTPAKPPSATMVAYLQQTLLSLLAFPALADSQASSALLTSLVEVLQSQSEVTQRIPNLIEAYYTSSSPHEASIEAAAFVDSRLGELGIDLSSRIPPRDMQPRLLRAYLEAGVPDQAKRLIRDVLEHDRTMHGAPRQHAAVAEIEADFVLGIVDANDVESFREVWTRAKAGWIGYSERSLCGSRTILNALVGHFGIARQHTRESRLANHVTEQRTANIPVQPFIERDFAEDVLTTFANIHLRWPKQSHPQDLKAYNNACRAFGYPEKAIKIARPSKAPPAAAQQIDLTAHRKALKTLTSSNIPDVDQLIRSMHPTSPLEERKSAAKQFISSIRKEGPAVTRAGSAADVRLRRFAAVVALDACWPPDVWATLLGDAPRASWSRDLRLKISQAAYGRWKTGELDEEYCLRTLRHLRSRWAREIRRDRHTRRLLMAQVRRRTRTLSAPSDV